MWGLALALTSQPLPELIANRKLVLEKEDSGAMRKGFDALQKCGGRPDSIVRHGFTARTEFGRLR